MLSYIGEDNLICCWCINIHVRGHMMMISLMRISYFLLLLLPLQICTHW